MLLDASFSQTSSTSFFFPFVFFIYGDFHKDGIRWVLQKWIFAIMNKSYYKWMIGGVALLQETSIDMFIFGIQHKHDPLKVQAGDLAVTQGWKRFCLSPALLRDLAVIGFKECQRGLSSPRSLNVLQADGGGIVALELEVHLSQLIIIIIYIILYNVLEVFAEFHKETLGSFAILN